MTITEKVIDSLPEIVFAPPFEDVTGRSVSACFHGLCLMRWRERRAETRKAMQESYAAFMRHLRGDCGC